jgi:outer membrane beta-barrel protein
MKKNQILLAFTTLILCAAQTTFAQSASGTLRSSDKVDLKKLEDKYWSAKDEDYGVIQNRTYAKAEKFYVSLVTGTLINDPFAQAKPMGAMLGYYFSEDFGVELSYINHDAKKNETVQKLNSVNVAVSPNYNLVKNSIAASASYTPFYAKMAFMNKSIMYFDMGFTAGVGMTTYDQVSTPSQGAAEKFTSQSTPHFELGFMQQLFISKHVAFRLDLKNTFYSQKVVPYQSNFNTTTGEETKSSNDTTLTFGVTLFTN